MLFDPRFRCSNSYSVIKYLLLILTVTVLMTAFVHAAAPDSQLRATIKAMEKSKSRQKELSRQTASLRTELKTLRQRLITFIQSIRKQENQIVILKKKLKDLNNKLVTGKSFFIAQKNRFNSLLLALQRMALYPPETLLVSPLPPSEMIRSAILLRTLTPEVKAQITVLKDNLDILTKIQHKAVQQQKHLTFANLSLEKERKKLDKLLARKTAIYDSLVVQSKHESQRIRELAQKSKDLESLIKYLEAQRREKQWENRNAISQKEQAILSFQPITKAKGSLLFPVSGEIVLRYGQKKQRNFTSKGIKISTQPGSRVVATYDGKIVFSGKFRGYGQLLIIEHGEGYHSLLAGMDHINADIGQIVLAGEPVGNMGTTNRERPALYLELRRNNRPINPLPWLGLRKDKTSG